MEITLLGIHSNYGIRFLEMWDNLAQDHDYCLTLVDYSPKMPVGHRCRWHADKALDPHIIFCLL